MLNEYKKRKKTIRKLNDIQSSRCKKSYLKLEKKLNVVQSQHLIKMEHIITKHLEHIITTIYFILCYN